MERVTKEILYEVGITPRYKGHWYIEYSIHILKHDEELLYKIAASLYSKVAAHYGISIYSVEYDIRTAIIIAWKTNRNLLEKICKVKLYKPPTNKEFLENLLSYVRKYM